MADDERAPQPPDEWLARVRVIETRPLAERAAAYAALHDELVDHLEAGPATPSV